MCNSRTAAQKSGGGGLPLGGFHFKVLALHSVVALRDPETVVHFFVESVCVSEKTPVFFKITQPLLCSDACGVFFF